MVTVTLNANGRRTSILTTEDKLLKDFIAEQQLNPSVVPYLDGAPISRSQMEQSFADLGITDTCVISSVVKTNNA